MTNTTNYRITNDSIIRIILWAGLAYCLFYFRDLVLTLLVGLVLASTIDPIAKFFIKYNISRVVTVSAIFILLFATVSISVAFIIPSLADDLARLLSKLPTLLNDITIFGKNLELKEVSTYITSVSSEISKGQILTVLKNSVIGAGSVANATGTVISSVINFVLTLVFTFYLAVQDDGINRFLKLITPKFYELYVLDLWSRSEKKIGSWAKGQIFAGVIMGLLVYICLQFINMPYASLFGFLSFLGEMIPMVGLLLSSIPAILVAYFTHDMTYALIVAAIFFVLAQLENYVIYPKIMNKAVGVPSIVILISFIIGAKVAGFWGVVLAVPMAAIMMELINDILNEKIPSSHKVEGVSVK